MQHNEIYERARLARDARFDGQFFVGVSTTGIYCRPICPAVSPKKENVAFFPSAAAASEAGFRPCLRCRPECAPGTPAWSGTSTTVRRGLRLISTGALDNGDVEQLAERLGVTSRHLRRLFGHHLGASPIAVAHTQRLHFAKRLIDETSLPMSQIALAAGYGSVRRFNDALKATYGRAPRDLRRGNVEQLPRIDGATLSVRLPYRTPFDWAQMLAFFSDRATPGVESVSGERYSRSIALDDGHGIIEVQPAASGNYLQLTLRGVTTASLFEVVQRCREMLDLDAPVADIAAVLGKDPALAERLKSHGGIRVPGSWDGFELTIRAILGQQVSVKAATTLAGRIAAHYGEPLSLSKDTGSDTLNRVFPTADRLVRARLEHCGIIRSRADTIRSVARAVVRSELLFDPAQSPQDFCTALQSIKGIGDWTAQYVAMRALKNPDAFPASDLGLIKAIEWPRRVTPAQLLQRAQSWRPWRAYAALLLWSSHPGSGG
ncbi:MAG: helix-turn-helix domain-containing protein [Gammaproteobacteria bacterium]|nr:helix-turn-helix domain-containing protein [Gammaproteobacteria bacterium]MDH4313790.1 helix-turn-helix domain-containing protein [Gammaproteobacteria bacterium]MDH5215164.1 helix-turn-helix domain-containing protein [Gammaproteobacteria bacterium]